MSAGYDTGTAGTTSSTGAATATGDDASIVDLLKRLTDQGSHLAQQQVALVKAEVSDSVGDVKAAIGAYAGAAVLGIGAVGVILMGLAYLLAENTELSLGASTLLVGLVTALVAYLLFRGAAAKTSATHLTPDRSLRTLERTPDAATGKL